MASSNLVQVAFIEESTYGTTPGAGNFSTARFTSEALSGTPETTESQQIRIDRLHSGQVLTGLTLGGDVNFELAKETQLEAFFESAFYSSFASDTPITVDYDIDTTAGTITRDSGDFNSDVVVGDILTLSGCSNSVNNTQVMVLSIDSATVISYVGPSTMVDETGSGNTFVVADKMSIGTTAKSFSMEKEFTDLTTKALIYKGMLVSGFSLSVAYGEIVNGTFSFSGNDYTIADQASEQITNGRTVDAAATTQSLNGSLDMAFIASSSSGTFVSNTFCIQSVELTYSNNLIEKTCIGSLAAQGYSPGTATIEVSMEAYLADDNWNLLDKKLDQSSFAMGFILKNSDGFYGFYMPAIQVSFDDPASPGQNQDVMISMTGMAKVGSSGESSLTMYKG
jgi:hypothetical protein